jgi:GNAT superfamily N-acetyltransferase
MVAITVEHEADTTHRDVLLDLLTAHNSARAGASGYATLAIVIRDDPASPISGGLWGELYFDWLFVELLFVPEALRNQGVGTHLLREAETIARQRGCGHVWLDTFSFQAPAFYRRHGYREFARLGDYPKGHERFFFRKDLAQV